MMMIVPVHDNDIDVDVKGDENDAAKDNGYSTTLASSYVIYVQDSKGEYDDDDDSNVEGRGRGKGQGPLIWTLVPLEETNNAENIPVGSLAIGGLKSSFDPSWLSSSDVSHTKIICNSLVKNKGGENEIDVDIDIKVEHSNVDNDGDDDINSNGLNALIAVLSRVMVQQKVRNSIHDLLLSDSNESDESSVKFHGKESRSSKNSNSVFVTISLPSNTGPMMMTAEKFSLSDLLLSSGGCPSLYKSLLNSDDISSIEMSDMVDSSGRVLGSVPRVLVHKHNILHRGVGIVVCRDEHITGVKRKCDDNDENDDPVDVYCHRRTDTKRIFPSLYDMFVGGVSVSGESSKLTAAREVAEELGLDRALDVESSNDQGGEYVGGAAAELESESKPLSNPLFQCTVCTSYNRCVVTVFTYQYRSGEDSIKWQEEEVSWGDFVPYRIVEQAAAMSIDRLIQSDQWPGLGDDVEMDILEESRKASLLNSDHECKDWDFVPDGLLVWMAWLNWCDNNNNK